MSKGKKGRKGVLTPKISEEFIVTDADLYVLNMSVYAGEQITLAVRFGRNMEFAGAQIYFVLRDQNLPNRMAQIHAIRADIYEQTADGGTQQVETLGAVDHEQMLAACVTAQSGNSILTTESVIYLDVTIPKDAQNGDIYRLELFEDSKYAMADGQKGLFRTQFGDIKVVG